MLSKLLVSGSTSATAAVAERVALLLLRSIPSLTLRVDDLPKDHLLVVTSTFSNVRAIACAPRMRRF